MKFQTAEELFAHYAQVKTRIRGPQPITVVRIAPPAPPAPEPVKPEPAPLPVPLPKIMGITAIDPDHVRVNFDEVLDLVLQFVPFDRRSIFADRRQQELCQARHLFWALVKAHCHHLSLPNIGRLSGGRDHTTVLHGVRKGIHHPLFAELDRALEGLYQKKLRLAEEAAGQAEAPELEYAGA